MAAAARGRGSSSGVLSVRRSLQFGVISVNLTGRDPLFGRLSACYSIHSSDDCVPFPGLGADWTLAVLFPQMERIMFLSSLATSRPTQYRTAGLQTIRSVGCDVVDNCGHFSI